jgi:hypothetical protein
MVMSNLKRRVVGTFVTGAAALSLLIAPTVVAISQSAEQTVQQARPCYNGIIPGNPYIRNCALPPRGHKIRGSAPDQNAIMACRGFPGCLSWYVNGPW